MSVLELKETSKQTNKQTTIHIWGEAVKEMEKKTRWLCFKNGKLKN